MPLSAKSLGELGLITEDERRRQHVCRLMPALPGGDVHEDPVAGGVIDRRPRGDGEASPRRERAPHLAEGGRAVGEVHERELADHDVETRVGEGKRGRIAGSPRHLRLGSRGDGQHPLIEIEADDLTVRPDPPQGLAGEYAGPAADVEDLVARPDFGGVGDGPAQAPKIAGTKQDS